MPASAAALRDGWKVLEVPGGSWCAAERPQLDRPLPAGWLDGGAGAHRAPARQGRVGAVSSRSSIYRCRRRYGLIGLRRRRKRGEDFRRWERDRLMQVWQIGVMGGVMLEDGAELKVVTGLDPEDGTTGRSFPPVPRPAVRRTWWRGGRRDDLQASRELQPGFTRFGSQPKEQSTMTLFRARSRRASS
jgi:hypothetical protein